MASFHLLRVLRPTCNHRQIYLSRTLPLYTGVFHRRFYSDKPIHSSQSSTEALVSPAKADEFPEEELIVSPRPRRGRPRKSARRHEFPEVELNVSTEAPVALEEGLPVKKTRPKVSRRVRKPKPTEDELNVSKLNLPPIDKWRQYFAIMEGQRLRFFLRNPDTARKLAEVFVPEGSKDLIVIEAAPGMHSFFFLMIS